MDTKPNGGWRASSTRAGHEETPQRGVLARPREEDGVMCWPRTGGRSGSHVLGEGPPDAARRVGKHRAALACEGFMWLQCVRGTGTEPPEPGAPPPLGAPPAPAA